jgi:hypothetical protein
MGYYGFPFVFRFPSLELSKQVRRVSLPQRQGLSAQRAPLAISSTNFTQRFCVCQPEGILVSFKL